MRFRPPLIILGLYLFLVILSGCETVKGAAAGFCKDWQNAEKVDKWLRERLW